MELPAISLFENQYGKIRYLMAPMAGITDITFRTLARRLGSHAVVSELLSAEGLTRGGEKTREMLRFNESERPVGIQLFGRSISSLVEAAQIVEGEGADFVDINFGCPVKKIVCDGGGAAWLRNPESMGELLTAIRSRLKIPLTIKVRTGWDENSINLNEVIEVAAKAGVGWVAVHGRTRAQGYAGLSDWELIQSAAQKSRIPVIGNGDILTASQATEKIEGGYAHAVMVGRGMLKNPWLFKELEGGRAGSFPELVKEHFELAISHKGKYRAFLSLKKFMAWYASGLPGSSNFRRELFQTQDIETLKTYCVDYFQSVEGLSKVDDMQPFLQGGHG